MEIYYGHPTQENIVGNIYKGKVEDVLPGLGSAFVDVGEKKSLFLSKGEINDQIMIEKGFKPWQGAAAINKLLRPGQTLTLQVRRGGIGSKNPQGTTKISLPGRFWVLLPTEDRLGVSRRIDSVRTQRQLRRVARQLKKEGQGMIARTAAQTASKEELARDYELLMRTWESIESAAKTSSSPQLLYKGMGLVQTILRDRLLSDVTEVIVDSEFFYEKILYFLEYMHMDQYKSRITLYEEKDPMFQHYPLEEQIQATQSRRVPLEGGGSIVIDETEALIAIDVNTGGDVQHRNQRSAILNTNLEAAAEIARQLRLRQMSGIIVVDFVDMLDAKDEQLLIDRVKEELRKDRISADFVDLTGLGLVEITRKRAGESLADMLDSAQFDA
jgi:ribonuclease G